MNETMAPLSTAVHYLKMTLRPFIQNERALVKSVLVGCLC